MNARNQQSSYTGSVEARVNNGRYQHLCSQGVLVDMLLRQTEDEEEEDRVESERRSM